MPCLISLANLLLGLSSEFFTLVIVLYYPRISILYFLNDFSLFIDAFYLVRPRSHMRTRSHSFRSLDMVSFRSPSVFMMVDVKSV